jgi:hypothetical protein
MTLVSTANIMGSDTVFIVTGRSFMYIMKSKGPRTDPWETPCFTMFYSSTIGYLYALASF